MEYKLINQMPYLRVTTAWMKGKTVDKAMMPDDETLTIHFTDGSRVEVRVMARYCDDAWLELRSRD